MGSNAGCDEASISAVVDQLAGTYGSPPWDAEIAAARDDYDHRRGRVFDDDELFAQHMALFIEWYVLERPLPDGRSPIAAAAGAEADEAQRELLVALQRSCRSLFEVCAARREGVLLADLVAGGRWLVDCAPSVGLGAGEILEARLVPWRGRVRFGPTALFHPRVARPRILRIVEERARCETLDRDVIDALAEMRLRFSRFRNIAIQHIYKEGAARQA